MSFEGIDTRPGVALLWIIPATLTLPIAYIPLLVVIPMIFFVGGAVTALWPSE